MNHSLLKEVFSGHTDHIHSQKTVNVAVYNYNICFQVKQDTVDDKCPELTSTSMASFSFLQVAEMVSVVPNSKYHNLFFILRRENKNN